MVALLVVFATVIAVLARQAGAAVDRARAQTAADAAALAGASQGRAGAEQFAAANGATLVVYAELDGETVDVTVRVGEMDASARASVDPVADGPPPGTDPPGTDLRGTTVASTPR
jgi:hypothetical protein